MGMGRGVSRWWGEGVVPNRTHICSFEQTNVFKMYPLPSSTSCRLHVCSTSWTFAIDIPPSPHRRIVPFAARRQRPPQRHLRSRPCSHSPPPHEIAVEGREANNIAALRRYHHLHHPPCPTDARPAQTSPSPSLSHPSCESGPRTWTCRSTTTMAEQTAQLNDISLRRTLPMQVESFRCRPRPLLGKPMHSGCRSTRGFLRFAAVFRTRLRAGCFAVMVFAVVGVEVLMEGWLLEGGSRDEVCEYRCRFRGQRRTVRSQDASLSRQLRQAFA